MFLSGSGVETHDRHSSNHSSPRSLTSPRSTVSNNNSNTNITTPHPPPLSNIQPNSCSDKLYNQYTTKWINQAALSGNDILGSILGGDSERMMEFRQNIQHLTFTEIYEKIERQHEEQKELLKLYCPRLYDELKITNEKLFSILVWIFTQIPLTQKYSKSLKKNFEKVFTAKTFVSLVTSQLHKISLPYFPNIIATPKSNADILDKLKNLYRSINNTFGETNGLRMNGTTTSILAPTSSSSQISASPRQQQQQQLDDSFSFKNDWTKVQAELLGQFFLEIGVIENVKPEKKKKFTERSHRYMFNSETIEYYAELLFVSAITSVEQRQVFEHWKMPNVKNPFSQFAHDFYSPFLNGISSGSMQLLTAGQLIQQTCLQSIILSQEKDFELVQAHIKKLHESDSMESTNDHSTNSSPLHPHEQQDSISLSTSSAYALVFRTDSPTHKRSKSKDMSRLASNSDSSFIDRRSFRMSNANGLSLKPPIGWESQSSMSLGGQEFKKRFLIENGIGDIEMQSPRTKFYEQHGIRAKVENLQQALMIPSVLEEFAKFCVTNHIEEIINCWKNIQAYMKMESAKDRKDKAVYIMNQFIGDSSQTSTPINIDSESREQLLTRIQSNLENFAFFTKDLFSNIELLLLNDLKEPFMNFNQKRNQEIDSEIDQLQEKLRLNAIQEEKTSKSFLSQVVSALKKKPTIASPTLVVSNGDDSIMTTKSPSSSSQQWNSMASTRSQNNSPLYPEMEKLPPHLYSTLTDVLTNRDAIKQFKIFCTSEHCEEYILFYEAVEDFRTLPSQHERIQKAKEIFETFIEIPLKRTSLFESQIRYYTIGCSTDDIDRIRKKVLNEDFSVEMFDDLSLDVQEQMKDVFERFAQAQREWKAKRMLTGKDLM
ncbi:hypothetical protein FDP41_007498 [Naegleria fowleri]|uniref:RGS domain-containing protein n=1 Tax=Naegleria fowleri TaxID=5763 RepID=A0A6A5CAP3_NAEFO|nr:uncharacterized protein FDP41_007498 [Naegleria fowleri]KAF0984321.1 hypothetical protein FDP41_007498 [Naegleria fowleri]CAG4707731.1 unnamed protein product [Naegleria fowleri]